LGFSKLASLDYSLVNTMVDVIKLKIEWVGAPGNGPKGVEAKGGYPGLSPPVGASQPRLLPFYAFGAQEAS
jgi:hypothetical protein